MKRDTIEDLARDVYPVIRPCAQTANGSISYTALCDRLQAGWPGIYPQSELPWRALGAIVSRCRGANLPALSALVVHASDKRPGNGYFEAAHPGIDEPMAREVAWGGEFLAVHSAKYPASFDELWRRCAGVRPAGAVAPVRGRIPRQLGHASQPCTRWRRSAAS